MGGGASKQRPLTEGQRELAGRSYRLALTIAGRYRRFPDPSGETTRDVAADAVLFAASTWREGTGVPFRCWLGVCVRFRWARRFQARWKLMAGLASGKIPRITALHARPFRAPELVHSGDSFPDPEPFLERERGLWVVRDPARDLAARELAGVAYRAGLSEMTTPALREAWRIYCQTGDHSPTSVAARAGLSRKYTSLALARCRRAAAVRVAALVADGGDHA